MGYFKAVRSGGEISMRIADLLETAAPKEYTGANRVKTILECNDVLQGRADNISIGMLEEFLEQKCGACYPERVAELKQEMEDFFHQKMLRTWRYTTTGKQTYDYEMYDFEPERPLKIINQQIFDDAAERGFPPDFFTKSYFDKVIIYCMPDNADLSFSHFHSCQFSTCGIRGAVFDHADLYDTDFRSALLQMVNFTEASIANCHFRDSDLASVSFEDARLKSCLTLDCKMYRVDFRGAMLDGASFGRIDAQHILNLYQASITQGGATAEEVRRLRDSIFRELNVPMFPAKQRPARDRRRKAPAPER